MINKVKTINIIELYIKKEKAISKNLLYSYTQKVFF